MRQLLPTAVHDVDPYVAYRPADPHAPLVRLNMITSLDGAATGPDGRAGTLQGEGDLWVFRALRALSDVILVGAGTVRAEDYDAPRVAAAHVEQRRADGRTRPPALAIVSRTLQLNPSAKVFGGGGGDVLIVTCAAAPAELRAELGRVCEVLVAGDDEVDLGAALANLRERGLPHVLSEGGPTLNAALLPHLDELCLTLGGLLVGGAHPRLVEDAGALYRLDLASVIEHAGELMLRYRLRRGSDEASSEEASSEEA